MENFSLACTEELHELFASEWGRRSPFDVADPNVPGPFAPPALMGNNKQPADATPPPPVYTADETPRPTRQAGYAVAPPPLEDLRLRKRPAVALEAGDPSGEGECSPAMKRVRSSRCLRDILESARGEESPGSEASTLISFNKRVRRASSPDGSPTNGATHAQSCRPANLDAPHLPSPRAEAAPGPGFTSSEDFYFRFQRRLEGELSSGYGFLPGVGPPGRATAPAMHATLCSWLVQVAGEPEFKLLPVTLFLGISLLERYLAAVPETTSDELQLLGSACLWLAAKYEEVEAPPPAEFCNVADKSFNTKELKAMKSRVLMALGWRVGAPTAWTMLSTLHAVLKLEARVLCLAGYLLELSLLEYPMLQFLPSTRAAAAIYLATLCIRGELSEGCLLFLESQCAQGIVPAVKILHSVHLRASEAAGDVDSIWATATAKYLWPHLGAVALVPPANLAFEEEEEEEG